MTETNLETAVRDLLTHFERVGGESGLYLNAVATLAKMVPVTNHAIPEFDTNPRP